jgi:very-short-patch-repair endonuclease
MGFVVLRIWNNEVFKNLDAVKEKILMALISNKGTPHLNPPPQGGRKSEAMR